VRRFSGGGTVKPASWGTRFPGRGGDTGQGAFYLRMEGLNAFLASLQEDFREAMDGAEDALRQSLRRRVLEPSLRLCPKDTGALRASAWVDAGASGAGYLMGSVGYDTDYAVYVHEVFANHKPPTQWKFLEQPFNENAGLVAMDVLDAVMKELGS
jgi:hypothetical protein